MPPPPVFCVEELTPALIEDLRDASATYCGYAYTCAFDDLILLAERRSTIDGFLAGKVPATQLATGLREWLLRRWSSTRTLGTGRMPAVGCALATVGQSIAAMAPGLSLEDATPALLAEMVRIFRRLDDCDGVGPTIASKLLAPLRPELFPMWDNLIAAAYGFALNSAGYHQYLNVTQAIARKARGFWHRDTPLEDHLKPVGRRWTAPLAKVLDEWNWVRITKKHAFPSAVGGR